MKKRFISRIHAITLSAIMCVGALPNTAFASTDDNTWIEISGEQLVTEDNLTPETEEETVVDQSSDELILETEYDTVINPSEDTMIDDPVEETMEIQVEETVIESSQDAEVVASGSCGENATYTITGTEEEGYSLAISGISDMYDFSSAENPWKDYRDFITNITISDGVTSIGDFAFWYFRKLNTVTLPDTLISIGKDAFGYCYSLRDIVLPESLTEIGDYAFGDTDLERITIPDQVSYIGEGAFCSCAFLTSVKLSNNINTIKSSAFSWCFTLNDVVIPDGVTCIEQSAFSYCKELTNIIVPKTVTMIEYYAFYGCSKIQSVKYNGSQDEWESISIATKNESLQRGYYLYNNLTPNKKEYTGSCGDNVSYNLSGDCFGYKLVISGSGKMDDYWHFDGFSPWLFYPVTEIYVDDGITNIGDYAFYELTQVTNIRIPKSVSTVGELAFFNCTSLSDIYYGGSNSDWNNIVWNDGMYSHENALKDVAIHYNSTGDPDKTFISDQPENISAGMNSVVTFSVVAKKANAYQWQYSTNGTKWYNSSASSAKTDTLTIKVSKSNANNMYRCKVTGTDGTVLYSESAGIDLIPGIVITKQPSSVTGKIGQTVTYAVTADNVDTYQWLYSKDGTNWYKSGATGCTTDTLSIKISSTNQNYYYKCKMIGIDGNSKNSGKAGAVIVTEQPKTCTASVGTTASYYVVAQNISTYQWQYSKDNGESWYNSSATGYNTDTISFKATSTNRATIYRCKLTSTNGLTAYTTAAGFAEGMKIVSQPENVSGSIGDRVTFNVNAQNVSTYQWQYSKDGNKWYNSGAVGNSTSSIQITVSTSNVNNVYRCKLTGTDDSVQYTNAVGVQSA